MKRWASILVLCESTLLLLGSSFLVFLFSQPEPQPRVGEMGIFFLRSIIPVCCFSASFYYHDLYDLRTIRSFGDFLLRLPKALGVGLLLAVVLYKVSPHISISPAQPILSGVQVYILVGGLVLPLRWILYRLIRFPAFAERVLILGTGSLAQKIAEEIRLAPYMGYAIVGVVDDRQVIRGQNALLGSLSWYPFFGPLDRLTSIVEELRPDRIIVSLAERRGRLPVRDLLNARMNGVVVEDGIEVHERFTEKLAIESLTPSFLFFSKNFTKSRLQLTLQRTLSLAFAVTGLVITAPLMVLIATAIKLDSKGPVFFVQERTGLRGRTFRLVKFRTMRPLQFDETEGELWSRNSEARITRVGRVLRKLRLDELPQFINILRGDMDLIGPRPEIAENVKTMTEQIPYYSLRMVVRPGITGWAQIKHGYSVSHEDVTEKMRYDLYYVKHMSLWFDLRILVDTVKIVLLGRGSEMREFLPTDVPKAEDAGPPVMRVLATKETTGRGQV